ncbi:hypothetical protein DN594_02420 [Enterobacter cloacae]|uniref:Uncharacterized protein n=2 Tax=Enterobacteriaceae TaxID=543 RepID=A0A2N5A720_KLEVA|nr:hypothetical protein C2U38_27255 [Citrobacter freundii complex sp. CFNIH3]AUW08314.1 hypothetical protein C2U42_03080 [Klebsiella oxytoca]AUZ62505.1 hypothetical protein C2U53_00730 [Citrobacter sp. CFNIH10]AUZ73208.1 hypothetical protein C2U41_28650 [Citrobacter freundii complex sp. CFNIH4]EFN5203028.1 hypothetical protein [Escherichia coli]OYQ91098.1 hypothetical protein B9P89_30205 [Citrobacter freundii]PLM90401.1 hypothetical protein CWN47_30715 [Klebsiella variicola]POV55128.1 hypoth
MRDRKGSPIHPFTLQSHIPLKAAQRLLCAVGVVTTRPKPQLGRISALAGRKSRLRACNLILQRYLLTYPAWPDLSNPSMANRRAVSHRGIPF